jgi:hypothetical protein
VDDAGPVRGVSETQNYVDKPQVEGDDFVTQQICICVSLFLPYLPYSWPLYSAPLARFAARWDNCVASKEKVCLV